MKYIKATDVLPVEILEIIQEYIDGEYIYIPRKCENHKSWGEKSGIKDSLETVSYTHLDVYKRQVYLTIESLSIFYWKITGLIIISVILIL